MKAILITDKGLEDSGVKEIKEKIPVKKTKIEETIIQFETEKKADLCRAAYTLQSIKRIMLTITNFKISKELKNAEKELREQLNKKEALKIIRELKNKKISVECERNGEHDFNSVDIIKKTSAVIKEQKITVNFKEYEAKIFIYIYNDNCYIGLDLAGRDLSKRNYRVFTNPGTLKGTIAFGLIKEADYSPKETMIDPNSGAGIIAIEAAIYSSKKPINYYQKNLLFEKMWPECKKIYEEEDKKEKKKIKKIICYDGLLRNISNAKKNSKIAGIEKNMEFSKTDIEWIDTKFEKETIDKVITKLPSESKRTDKKKIRKLYEELFYQTEFILKKNGLIIICTLKNDLLKEVAGKKGFKILSEKKVFSGQQPHIITKFEKVYK